jgi:hypothetical protein
VYARAVTIIVETTVMYSLGCDKTFRAPYVFRKPLEIPSSGSDCHFLLLGATWMQLCRGNIIHASELGCTRLLATTNW